MGKLIELDAALDALREVIVPAEDVGFGDELTDGYNDGINMAVTVVSGLPTVDAVQVVRCKDCKYWKTAEGVNLSKKVKFCTYHIGHRFARRDEDFCSRGERKDGEYEQKTG